MHGSSHEGMVLSGVRSLMLLALIRVKQRFVGWTRYVVNVTGCRFGLLGHLVTAYLFMLCSIRAQS